MEKINNIYQLIYGLITFMLVTEIPLFSAIIGKIKENKKLKKELASKIDIKQNLEIVKLNEKIDAIASTVQDISERMERNDFKGILETKIITKVDTILRIKELNNNEMRNAIINGLFQFNKLIEFVLNSNFNLSNDKLKELIYSFLKTVKFQISRDKLRLYEAENFLEELENLILKPESENFIFRFSEIAKLNNGVRRAAFGDLCENYICAIVEKTVTAYNNG